MLYLTDQYTSHSILIHQHYNDTSSCRSTKSISIIFHIFSHLSSVRGLYHWINSNSHWDRWDLALQTGNSDWTSWWCDWVTYQGTVSMCCPWYYQRNSRVSCCWRYILRETPSHLYLHTLGDVSRNHHMLFTSCKVVVICIQYSQVIQRANWIWRKCTIQCVVLKQSDHTHVATCIRNTANSGRVSPKSSGSGPSIVL